LRSWQWGVRWSAPVFAFIYLVWSRARFELRHNISLWILKLMDVLKKSRSTPSLLTAPQGRRKALRAYRSPFTILGMKISLDQSGLRMIPENDDDWGSLIEMDANLNPKVLKSIYE
jgi:hypothetical protein